MKRIKKSPTKVIRVPIACLDEIRKVIEKHRLVVGEIKPLGTIIKDRTIYNSPAEFEAK